METVWTKLGNIYYANQLAWNIAFGVLLILCGAYIPSSGIGRGLMLRRERRNFVRSMIIDELVNIVELRVFNGEITRKEASEIYRDARKYWPVRDLFPAPELLKEAIKKRTKTSINDPVILPDCKPKIKHMFDKSKSCV